MGFPKNKFRVFHESTIVIWSNPPRTSSPPQHILLRHSKWGCLTDLNPLPGVRQWKSEQEKRQHVLLSYVWCFHDGAVLHQPHRLHLMFIWRKIRANAVSLFHRQIFRKSFRELLLYCSNVVISPANQNSSDWLSSRDSQARHLTNSLYSKSSPNYVILIQRLLLHISSFRLAR